MSLVKTILEGNKIEYDDTEFEIVTNAHKVKYLHYIGNGKNITNPKGNTSCYAMFQYYEGTELDLTNFDTQNITNMSFMFFYCNNLKTLYLENFNTKNVIDMSGMFSNCAYLKNLDLSNFDTSKVTSMDCMFYNCFNLEQLDLSDFNTNKITDMDNMFYECINLETLKVGSDYLQFFSINRGLLDIGNNVNIIPVTKIDRIINDLFY